MFSSIIPCFKLAVGVSFKDFEWQNQTLLWDWHLTIKQLAQAPRALCSADPFVTKKRNHGSLWEQNHQWCRDRHRHHEVPMPEGSKVELLKEVLVLTSWWKLVHSFSWRYQVWGFFHLKHSLHSDFYRWRHCTLKSYFHEFSLKTCILYKNTIWDMNHLYKLLVFFFGFKQTSAEFVLFCFGVRHPAMQSLALTTTEKMGWIPDIPDHRDLFMTFSTSKEAPKEIHRNLGWWLLRVGKM